MIQLGWTLAADDLMEPAAIAEALSEAQLQGAELIAADLSGLTPRAEALAAANVEVIGIATSLPMPSFLGTDSAWLDSARRAVMAAAEFNCPQVRLTLTRSTHRPSIARLAEQLSSIGELADEVSIKVVLDAREQFDVPADLWRVLELTASSNLAASLPMTIEDRFVTGAGYENTGQNPAVYRSEMSRRLGVRQTAVSIPLLNSRIHHVSVKCVAPIATPPRSLAGAIHHLLGVGYSGWMTIEASRESLQTCATMLRTLTSKAAVVRK